MTFKEFLKKRLACEPAIEWVGDKTIEQSWSECDQPWWMAWLVSVSGVMGASDLYPLLIANGFRSKENPRDVALLDNPAASCSFFRTQFTVEQIKQAIGIAE